ncbi:MAG: FAD-dependent oxidoreductase [Halioglobus sp.]
MKTNFPALTQTGKIGNMVLKNRMVVTAMGTNMAEADGSCGQRLIDYHERQAKGGAALIIMGVAGVAWPDGGNMPRQIAISEDRFIPGLKNVADAVHAHGAKLATQIHHGGLVAAQDMKEGRPIWAPSIPVSKAGNFMEGFLESELAAMYDPSAPPMELHVMTVEDIAVVVGKFAAAALRAKTAGLDGVEIHGGHGYLISAFLSPRSNQRDDDYGGSLENRARLLLEVITAVRAAVGPGYPVWCKLDSSEFGVEEGISLADARATAKMAEAAGVDAITVSAYHDGSQGSMHSESNIPHVPERLVANATSIKQAVNVPVITSGRIEPGAADSHVRKGHFDFFAMGRKILADPDLPKKIIAGTPQQVRPCVYCYCCASQIYVLNTLKCAVNPETGRERERALIASDKSKHFVVVGGGPGGMEVAHRLDKRGFKVTLVERSNRLGGTLQFAGIAYPANERLLHWLRLQVAESGVEVKLNTTATAQLVHSLSADEVIVATGARRDMPPIPGSKRNFVFSGDEMRAMVMAEDNPGLRHKTSSFTRLMTSLGAATRITEFGPLVRFFTKFWLPLGQRVTIIGGELVGLELAEFLAERGRQVTVIDTPGRAGKGLYLVRRLRLLDELNHLGVTLLNNASDISIGDHTVSYTNYRGQQRSLDVDHIIVAKGATGDLELAEKFGAAGMTVHTIGDCNGVGYIEGAIESAAELAVKLG